MFDKSTNPVAIFVEDQYFADLMRSGSADISRFFVVHAPDSGISNLTWEKFAEVKNRLKKRLKSNDGNKRLNELQKKGQIDYSAFGIFYENDYAIGYLDIVKGDPTPKPKYGSSVILLSTNIVNVGDLLLFNVYSDYKNSNDINWLKQSSERWSNVIYKENNMFANENWREQFRKLLENME